MHIVQNVKKLFVVPLGGDSTASNQWRFVKTVDAIKKLYIVICFPNNKIQIQIKRTIPVANKRREINFWHRLNDF